MNHTIREQRALSVCRKADSANLSDAVIKARQRHGKPFSFEHGSDWKPHDTPVLTEWLQSRGKSESK